MFSLRRACDLREATAGEWRVAGLVGLVIASLFSSGDGYTGVLALFLAHAAVLGCGLVFAVKLLRRRASVGAARGAFLLAVLVVAGLIVGVLVSRYRVAVTERRGDVIASALVAYRDREGYFPETLTELVPRDLPTVPVTDVGLFTRLPFSYKRQGNDFLLQFRHGVMSHGMRTSGKPWQWWD